MAPIVEQGDGACALGLGEELVLIDEFQCDSALFEGGQDASLLQLGEELQLFNPARGRACGPSTIGRIH